MLRDYQARAVSGVQSAWQSHNAVLLVSPTGSGKTKTAVLGVMRPAVLRGQNVLFVVQLRQVVRQTAKELEQEGLPHGILMAGHKPKSATIQVASVQTIAARQTLDLPRFDLVVIDECQHAVADQYRKLLERVRAKNPAVKVLGLSATPIRGDGKGLGVEAGGIFESLVLAVQPPDLMRLGFLCPVVMYGVSPDDLGKLKVDPKTSDYDETQLSALMRQSRLVGEAVEHYRQRADGQRCIVFCVDVAHTQVVAEQYRTAGYKTAVTTAKTPHGERQRILQSFQSGEIKILVNCDVYTEGFDEPLIGCVQVLRPTRSLSRWLQAAGRGLRPITPEYKRALAEKGISVPAKPHVVLLDHGGNVQRHGSPLDARLWTLAGHDTSRAAQEKIEEQNAARVLKCKCGALVMVTQSTCTACGEPVKKPEKPPASAVEVLQGRLVQLLTGNTALAPGVAPTVTVIA